MIRVEVELSAPSTVATVEDVAVAVSSFLANDLVDGIVVHRVTVEEADA